MGVIPASNDNGVVDDGSFRRMTILLRKPKTAKVAIVDNPTVV